MVYALGIGGGIVLLFPRFFHKISIVNVDGLEWKRQKFSFIEKKILHLFFNLVAMSANYVIIDNRQLINYVIVNQRKIIYIPNGIRAHAQVKWDVAKLAVRYGSKVASMISRAAFWLVVARLEPENNIHIIVEAFMKVETRFPLVIIGDFTSSVYKNEIYAKLLKSERILFLGALYDIDLLDMLRQNCFAYIHGHSVGGTNPSLLEIMSMEKIVIAYASVFNKEVGQESLLYFRNSDELSQLIIQVEANPSANAMAKMQIQRIRDEYNWNAIVEKYESLLSKI
jgi:rhamnosyltransferase